MGYSANSIHSEQLTIKKEDVATFDALLDTAEANSNIGGHISWCDPMEVIRARHDGDHTKVVTEVLVNYGFEGVSVTDAGDITVEYWGGDKIGSSWDPIWNALGEVVKHSAKWIMVGEDNEMWGEAIVPGRGRFQFGLSDLIANLDPVALHES